MRVCNLRNLHIFEDIKNENLIKIKKTRERNFDDLTLFDFA